MITYRREIDGLRAFAVVPVILFHADFSSLSGGFVGVDVFFVISGYLITSIIISEMENEKFRISDFWERRARRILPALLLVLASSVPASFFLLAPFELRAFFKSLLAASMFYSNFHFLRDGGYFETAAELKPLLHTWSLAVEEQYYVFFPLLILLLWRYRKRARVAFLALVALGSFSLCLWASLNSPDAAFFMLPMRFWELSVGAFVAFCGARSDTRENHWFSSETGSLCGFILIFSAYLNYSSITPFPSFYAVVPTLGSALIIVFATPATMVGRFLASRAMVSVGLLSYSAYLWHQPVLAFLRHFYVKPNQFVMLLGICLVFCLSALSWRYVELPFRNRVHMPRSKFFKWIIFLTSTIIAMGLAGAKLFSSKAKTGFEEVLAEALTEHDAVYSVNMDERLFVRSRIARETMRPDTLVLGSSRMMQVGAAVLGGKPLNLAVSGASLEDLIALSDLAFDKFQPNTVLIGGDPWLFNRLSGQTSWQSISSDYESALAGLRGEAQRPPKPRPPLPQWKNQVEDTFYYFYRRINCFAKTFPAHNGVEMRPKILSDGSHVYRPSKMHHSPSEILRGVETALSYGMTPYDLDTARQHDFERLLSYYKVRADVVLVLSPYHPAVYGLMENERRVFLEMEQSFVEMGRRLGVKVIGSYNPVQVGCDVTDFYDGMHPTASGMKKVLEPLVHR
jgi:peptidoglycan/LPS O-acetylase OafA/YrhL